MNSDNESVEASYAVGLKVEADISERFSIGLGLGYTTLKTVDFFGSTNGTYQSSYHNDYSNFYGNGREVEYSNLNFEAYTKFFIIETARFRPYVGAGLSYNRTQMNYGDNRDQQVEYQSGANTLQYQFGDEEVISSHMKFSLVGGTEMQFTENIGVNLELQYSRAIGGNLSSETQQYSANSPDQQRLQDLNEELLEANNFSIFAGMLFTF
jgi:opacity protein-like surface antigen